MPQPIGDDRVQLFVAESGDAIQGTHLAVRNKMNMGVDEPRENRRGGVLGNLPGLVELKVPGFDADDLFLIEKYGRWSFAELFPREHPRASDGHHQHVILRGPSPVKAGSELMRGMTKATRWSSPPGACTLEDGDADIPDLQSPPPMNRGSGCMSGSKQRPECPRSPWLARADPLVAIMTVAAGSRIAALKIKNLTVFAPVRHRRELIDRAVESTRTWIAEGGLTRREIPHQMHTHKHH